MQLKYGSPLLTHIPLLHQGKSRDTYPARYDDIMLISATRRVSTHNVVHKSQIPTKDQVITMLTVFFLEDVLERSDIQHHLVAYGPKIYDYAIGNREDYPPDFHYHTIAVKKIDIVLIEFIFRAYLAGSLWKNFYSKGVPDPYGLELPQGLPYMHRFEEPIFTPTDKSEHDLPQPIHRVLRDHPGESFFALRVFTTLRTFLRSRGLEAVDGKFEVGISPEGDVVLGDEVSPDSLRLCWVNDVREGKDPSWRDKQIVRDAAEKIWGGTSGPPLEFSEKVVKEVADTYMGLVETVTGKSFAAFRRERFG